MAREEGTPEELAASIEARVADQLLDIHERYVALLRLAASVRDDSGLGPHQLAAAIAVADKELADLSSRVGGRITGRKKPKDPNRPPPDDVLVFMDECGNHNLAAKDKFGVFVLAAVIVPSS